RSGNPRLAVETLLLRWAMLDRIVDLAQVIQGGPTGASGGAGEPRRAAAPPTATPAPGPPGAQFSPGGPPPDGPAGAAPAGRRVLRGCAPVRLARGCGRRARATSILGRGDRHRG